MIASQLASLTLEGRTRGGNRILTRAVLLGRPPTAPGMGHPPGPSGPTPRPRRPPEARAGVHPPAPRTTQERMNPSVPFCPSTPNQFRYSRLNIYKLNELPRTECRSGLKRIRSSGGNCTPAVLPRPPPGQQPRRDQPQDHRARLGNGLDWITPKRPFVSLLGPAEK